MGKPCSSASFSRENLNRLKTLSCFVPPYRAPTSTSYNVDMMLNMSK